MASVASKPRTGASSRRSPTREARAKDPQRPRASAQAAKKKAQKKTGQIAREVVPGGRAIPSRLAGAAAKKTLKFVARKAVRAGVSALRAATERGGELSRNTVHQGLGSFLPIQVSVDVAVPLSFAWDEWMTFEWLNEGVHRIVDVERDGDQLFGQLPGPRSTEWVADIVDEREEQSFAWRSVEGSDCAGLVTFHRLSDRLTRIEVDLDVLPTNPAEAASLALRIGRRRVESDLRRFKAHVEFVNPDVYEDEDEEEPEEEQYESDEGEEPEEDNYEDEDQ
jgi:uncharacterized membrane protein